MLVEFRGIKHRLRYRKSWSQRAAGIGSIWETRNDLRRPGYVIRTKLPATTKQSFGIRSIVRFHPGVPVQKLAYSRLIAQPRYIIHRDGSVHLTGAIIAVPLSFFFYVEHPYAEINRFRITARTSIARQRLVRTSLWPWWRVPRVTIDPSRAYPRFSTNQATLLLDPRIANWRKRVPRIGETVSSLYKRSIFSILLFIESKTVRSV